ncbi:hypothetical protein Pla8534_14240 [Lignipirellula cremea]|uniref:Uncharacterized protein n=1 Tax=Lignipirellula cremea TaxID=2528010 RepID=A0A518DP88_9BACT|nr:hypothetical protein Pla8534_14240 [Lignipirellula cremea]
MELGKNNFGSQEQNRPTLARSAHYTKTEVIFPSFLIPFSEASIWVYDSVQFNFDDEALLKDTLIQFDNAFDGTRVVYSPWKNGYIALTDLDPAAICTPHAFVTLMSKSGISTSLHEVSSDHVRINGSGGVQARFWRMKDVKREMVDGALVFSDFPYLHMVSTVHL